MNFRLQQFLAAENISQAQFADQIGVARASVSHIIAGRNKPGFDFIQNMSRAYPDLNLEWLINGKGRMYKDGVTRPSLPPQSFPEEEGALFEQSEPQTVPDEAPISPATAAQSPLGSAAPAPTPVPAPTPI